jgi:glutathione peroxidase-family protein
MMQRMYATHQGKGFEILAFPCNQFAGQVCVCYVMKYNLQSM